MGENFYASLINSIANEKTASEKDAMNIMQSTTNMSVDQMKSLADALTDSYQEKVAQATLEESLMKKRADEEEDKEDKKEDHHDDKEKDASNCKSADDDDDDDDDKKEHHDDGKPYDGDNHHDKEKEVDVEVKEEKSAEEFTDEELTVLAYEQLEEKLANEGYTLEDYVFTKTADEDTSLFIADKASKLAYLAEQPVLKVADDILDCMVK